MADDIVLNPGSAGDKVAADDVGGKKYQYVKLVHGVDDTITKVSDTDPLPVDNREIKGVALDVNAGAAGTGTQRIVLATDTVKQATAADLNVTEVSAAAIKTAAELIDDAVHARNAAFSKSMAIGGELDDTATSTPTEGQVAPIRITAQRAAHANLRDNAGNEVGTAGAPLRTDPTGATTQPVSGSVTEANSAAIKTATELIDDGIGTDAGAHGASQKGMRSLGSDGTNDQQISVTGAGHVNIADGGNSLTVDGTITEANSAAVKTAVELIDDGIGTDAGAHGASQKGMRALGTDGTNDQQISTNATGHVNIADGGNVISVDDGGSTLSIDDGAGSLTVDGTVTADAGTGTFAVDQTDDEARLNGVVRNDIDLSDGTTSLPTKFAVISESTSGDRDIVSAVAGKKIRVLSVSFVVAAAVNLQWKDSTPTNLSGVMNFAANGGMTDSAGNGLFETASNTILRLNLSGSVGVGGRLSYIEV